MLLYFLIKIHSSFYLHVHLGEESIAKYAADSFTKS